MDIATLEKANRLNRKIEEFKQVLGCFEWPQEYGGGTRNPRLILEFDDNDDFRDTKPLPMELSKELLSNLKKEIIEGRDAAIAEFNFL